MKIYRATVSFNNGDSNEWEEWRTINSKWYDHKEVAEKYLPEMQKFLDDYCNSRKDECNLQWVDPHIEEQEIGDVYTPINLTEEYIRYNVRNKVTYIPYDKSYNITGKYGSISCRSLTLTLEIGEYSFGSYIDLFEPSVEVKPVLDENTTYFHLSPSVRQKMLDMCKEEIAKLIPYLNKEVSDEELQIICKKFGYKIAAY